MPAQLPPNTPILVGIGVTQQREDDPSAAVEAIELMIRATRAAASDAGSEALLAEAQRIAVPKGIWGYSDPARQIADSIGAGSATTVLAEIGILQQSLIADACNRIADGQLQVAIVAGGEAKYRALRAQIAGSEASETVQDATPDVTLQPEAEIWSPVESAAGLGMPVGYYAIMESALRAALGEGVEQHRDRLASLYAGFAEVASANPHAWNRNGMSFEAIREPGPKNAMLAFPYSKYHNSQWNVDQAASLIFCSVAKAEALGIPRDKWLFPQASTECNHMVNTCQRPDLASCPGAALAGQRALALAGSSADSIELLDMYSCFPAAVQIYARELGIALDRPLTVTGGMTFGGGPLNNYVLQATARMGELLREQPGKRGLVTSVSGMLTKQGFGIYASEPNPDGFQYADLTEQVAALPIKTLVEPAAGNARIAGYTVLYSGGEPSRAVAVCDLENGARTVVYSEDVELMGLAQSEECVGKNVSIDADGRFSLTG